MKINNDQVCSILGLIIGSLIVIHSFHYDLGTLSSPGHGFFPLVGGICITLFSSLGLVIASFQSLKGIGWTPVIKGMRWKRPLIAFASLFFYVFIVNHLGFILTTALFIGFILRVLEQQRWPVVVSVSIVCAMASYGLFGICLDAQLPSGFLGF